MSYGEERHLHPPPSGLFFRPPTGRVWSCWGGGTVCLPAPHFPPAAQGSIRKAVGCRVLLQSPKPVARAPPSATSRALQWLRWGVGEAQPPAAGLRGCCAAPTWGSSPGPDATPAGTGAPGHGRRHSRPASRRGHVVRRLCWERGPGHGKGPAKGLGIPLPPFVARMPMAECGW